MKKIILLLIIFISVCTSAFSFRAVTVQEHENFMKSLNLSKVQKEKIEIITQDASKKANILNNELRNEYKSYNNCKNNCSSIQANIKILNNKLYKLNQQKNDDIMRVLNIFQKERYKEYISRVY